MAANMLVAYYSKGCDSKELFENFKIAGDSSFKEHLNKTPIQMLLRGQNLVGYKHYADDVVKAFVEKSYENGVDIFRIFDALNDSRNMKMSIKTAKDQGAYVQGTISYTISPVHTIEKYVEFAKELAAMDCDAITIKDISHCIKR